MDNLGLGGTYVISSVMLCTLFGSYSHVYIHIYIYIYIHLNFTNLVVVTFILF